MKKPALLCGFVALSIVLLALITYQSAQAQFRSDAIDVILVIDTSGSMRNNDPQGIRISAAKLFVDLSSEGDRIGVVSMSGRDHTEIVAGLTSINTWLDYSGMGRRALKDALEPLATPTAGGTFMGQALRHAYNMLSETGPGRRQFVVLLTDGVQESESRQVLDTVLTDFENSRFWKIFPIALGEGADFAFLQTEVAGRTGGQAFKAATPEELIKVYTEIFALIRYNAYVNFIPVETNSLQTLATVVEDQRVTSLAFIIPRVTGEGQLPIETLISPADVNLVDPAYAGGVYHAYDSRYEAWVVERDAVLLDGTWQMRLLGDGAVDVAVLIRSELGIQLSAPPPQYSWDELSARYVPAGHPAIVNVGVLNAALPSQYVWDPSSPTGLEGQLERFLSPVVRISSPQGERLALTDDGQGPDMAEEDGRYTGLCQIPEDAGEYILEVEIPSEKEDPIRLFKERVMESRPLPLLSIEIPATERAVPDTSIPITLLFLQPTELEIPVNSADVIVQISEPNGNSYDIDLDQETDRFLGSFTPSIEGVYQVSAWANIRVSLEGEEITYTDFAQASYGAEPIRSLLVSAQQTSITTGSIKNMQVTVAITSESPEEQTLKASVEDLEGGSLLPGRITVPPQDVATFTFRVSGSEEAAREGQFTLILAPEDTSVVVENGEVTVHYQVGSGGTSGICPAAMLSLGVLAVGLLTITRTFAGGQA